MSEQLTMEQRACNGDTSEHIRQVVARMHRVVRKLLERADRLSEASAQAVPAAIPSSGRPAASS